MINRNGGEAGGVSNTPPKKYRARSTCIDYFTFRINHNYDKDKELFNNLFKILHIYLYETKTSKGRNNYTTTMSLAPGISLSYGGTLTRNKNGEETSVLELKGSGCREFEERYYALGPDFKTKSKEDVVREGWIKLFEECIALDGVCTRIDLPTDDFSGLITIEEIKGKIQAREYTTRMRKLELTNSNNEEDDDEGFKEPSKLDGINTIRDAKLSGYSATFGNRRHVQLCIYDKKAEQLKKGLFKEIDSWIRYEVRYYHDNAELEMPLILENLRNQTESKHIASCLAGIFEFKESNRLGDTNRSKNLPWKKWIEFIGDAGKKGSFSNSPKTMTIESNAAWLAIDASASLGKIASCLEVSYSELMGAYIARWIRKIDKEHLQAINQYRRDKGLPTFQNVDQIAAYHMHREDFPESFHQETVDYILAITTTSKVKEKKEDDEEGS